MFSLETWRQRDGGHDFIILEPHVGATLTSSASWRAAPQGHLSSPSVAPSLRVDQRPRRLVPGLPRDLRCSSDPRRTTPPPHAHRRMGARSPPAIGPAALRCARERSRHELRQGAAGLSTSSLRSPSTPWTRTWPQCRAQSTWVLGPPCRRSQHCDPPILQSLAVGSFLDVLYTTLHSCVPRRSLLSPIFLPSPSLLSLPALHPSSHGVCGYLCSLPVGSVAPRRRRAAGGPACGAVGDDRDDAGIQVGAVHGGASGAGRQPEHARQRGYVRGVSAGDRPGTAPACGWLVIDRYGRGTAGE